MPDYIEREQAVTVFKTFYGKPLRIMLEALAEEHAADVRPVVRGHWTNHRTLFTDGDWHCSACGKAITIYMGPDREDRYAYCPNCGAEMRGGDEDA